MWPIIEFLDSNYFFKATFSESSEVDFLLVRIPQNRSPKMVEGPKAKPTKKFIGQVKLEKESILSQFSSTKELFQFMKDAENYEIDENFGILLFKWEIFAGNYRKAYSHKIELSACPLDEEECLQCEVFVLRKQIAIYEEAERKRLGSEIKEKEKDEKQNLFKQEESFGAEKQVNNQLLKTKKVRKDVFMNDRKRRIKRTEKEYIVVSESEKNEGEGSKREASEEELSFCFYEKERKETDKESNSRDNKKAKKQESLSAENVSNNSKVSKIKGRGRPVKRKRKHANELESESDESCDDYKKVKVSDEMYHIRFKNGDFYEGEIKNRLFEGFGKYTSKTMGVLTGYWKNGKPNGHCVLIGVNKNKYEGEFKDDLRHGKGVEVYDNGDRYEGEYSFGLKNGIGTYYYSNGDWWKGEWKDDKQEGKGVEYENDGSEFIGTWENDLKHGEGVLCSGNRKVNQLWEKGELIKEWLMN